MQGEQACLLAKKTAPVNGRGIGLHTDWRWRSNYIIMEGKADPLVIRYRPNYGSFLVTNVFRGLALLRTEGFTPGDQRVPCVFAYVYLEVIQAELSNSYAITH